MAVQNDATILSGGRPAARFVVKQGPQIGITFPIVQSRLLVGREESCDIRVQDAEASRRHCEVVWQNGAFVVQDLGSSNGTFVNGVQITAPTRLSAGDKIGVGQTVMVLELEPEIKPVPTPYDATPSAAPVSAPVPVVKKKKSGGKRLVWTAVGCLVFVCACGGLTALGLDLLDFIDLGIPGFSNLNLIF